VTAAIPSDPVALARQHYAEELRHVAGLRSPAVVAAFASVPRERFLGPGPWRIRRPMAVPGYWTTDDADPRHVYHNVLVALDEAREINNGQPSLWAFLFEQLGIRPGERVRHLGCGTGYYTAVAAELAGPHGALTAVELDPGLATKAAEALTPWPQVWVLNEDGASAAFEPVDLIIASAGATHPPASWLDGLAPGGRLLFPLTADSGPGAMLLVTRQGPEAFAARFLCMAQFIDFQGARDSGASRSLLAAFRRTGDGGPAVQSLRRHPDEPDGTCWLAGDGWWLSTAPAAPAGERGPGC